MKHSSNPVGTGWAGAHIALLAVLCLLAPASAFSQETTGTITGEVKDPTGAVIPGATVSVTNQGTEISFDTTTGEAGVYLFRELEPGRYTVTFEAPGFKKQEAPDTILLTGRTLRVNATLEVGDVTETIVVSEAAQLIDTSSTMVAQNISSEEFDLLPKGRNFIDLAVLSPSVNTGQLEGGFQINGASGAENNYYIDGVSVNSVINGSARQGAQFDYIQEVQVKTNGLEAEYGGALGGVVTAITKSGGNEFHGSAHTYYYGNAIGAGPTRRLELDPSTQATDAYIQDEKQTDNNWEFGGSLGGPIVKNKLFFFTAGSPRWRTRDYDYLFSNGSEPGSMKRTFRQVTWFNKIDYNPTQKIRTNFTYLFTPTKQTGSLYTYDGFAPNVSTRPLATAQAQANDGFDQPEYTLTGQLDFNLTSTSLLSVRGGRYYLSYEEFGIEDTFSYWFITPSVDLEGVPPGLQQAAGFTTPSAGLVINDTTTRTYINADYSKFFTGWGQHNFKAGVGTAKNVNNVNDSWNGPDGRVRVFWNAAFRGDRGDYGYYLVEDGATQGSTGAHLTHIYIQDQWRIHPRLTLNLGLRTEQETIPSFARSIQDIAFKFNFADKLSPRLGASYDVFGDGRLKISGSYARLYDWTKYDLARGTFGADKWHIYYRSLDDPSQFGGDPNDPSTWTINLNNMPGRNLWATGEFRDLRAADFSLLDPNVKPMSSDVMNFGMEWAVDPQTIVSARYTRNDLVRTIEDLGALDDAGNEVYSYGNPGESRFTVFPSSGATCVVEVNGTCGFPMPKAERTYNAMELQISRRMSNGWFGTASYVYSRLYGNYAGLQSTDEIRAPTIGTSFGGDQQFGGQSYRPGGNANRYFDLDEILYDAYGNVGVPGRLATDRPHVVKLYGGKHFGFGTEVGGFFRAMSGTPITTQVWTINGIPVFVEGRGDAGRNPFFTQTDLVVAHNVSVGENKTLRFEFNFDNLFNQKTSMYNFPNYNKEERGASSEIDLSETDLSQGFDWRQMVLDTDDGEFAKDPRYLKGALFNPGFQGRFQVKFIF